MIKKIWHLVVFTILIFGFVTIPTSAQSNDIFKGRIISVEDGELDDTRNILTQDLEVRILEGVDKGDIANVSSTINSANSEFELDTGDSIYLFKGADGKYYFGDRDRLPQIWMIFGLFFVVVVALAGKRGFGSIIGLASSVLIIAFYIIPMIIAGNDPFIASVQGIVVAAVISFYFAHGFNRRTSIALVGTMLTLFMAGVLAWYFTRILFLTGNYSEDTLYLRSGVLENLDLRGLFLGGVMLGTIGVLDDVTTSQAAAVEQLKKANFNVIKWDLFKRTYEIGKQHIAGLVNTLAFAYIGSSFALILLFSVNNNNPWWFILNSEFIATEIIQSLVGSMALVLAVPITTFLAVQFYDNMSKEDLEKNSSHEVHSHTHVH